MNPVALITGASRGIGRGIALELAKLGWDLVLNYVRDVPAAKKTSIDAQAAAKRSGKFIQARICQANIASPSDRERLLAFTHDQFHRLDMLVNNAGIAPQTRTDLLEVSEASFDRLFEVNAKGAFFLTQLAAKQMLKQRFTKAQRGNKSPPKIVTISSISAYTASINRGEYCVAKAALSMLTPLFASRLAAHGINVYEIRPGLISTDMTAPVKEKYDRLIAKDLTPIPRWGTPEDVGRAVAAIAQDLLPFSTGEVLNVDGGFHLRRL